eukprot:11228113-Lingulodinium_polyedra.AAC.1
MRRPQQGGRRMECVEARVVAVVESMSERISEQVPRASCSEMRSVTHSNVARRPLHNLCFPRVGHHAAVDAWSAQIVKCAVPQQWHA